MSNFSELIMLLGLIILVILMTPTALQAMAGTLPPLHKTAIIYGTVLSAQCTQAWFDSSRVVIRVYNGTSAGQQGVYTASYEECLVFAAPANSQQLWRFTIHTDNGWIVDYRAVSP